jgi:hypothetical protein
MVCFVGRQNLHGETQMRIALFAAVAAIFACVSSAQAMTAASLKGLSKSDSIVHVRGGCGPLRHRGPHGHCRPGP